MLFQNYLSSESHPDRYNILSSMNIFDVLLSILQINDVFLLNRSLVYSNYLMQRETVHSTAKDTLFYDNVFFSLYQ